MANDAKDRVRSQREARLMAGWHEVRTWVPTKQDADDILALAQERRDRASQLGHSGETDMKPKNLKKIIAAIAAQGRKKFNTPSGPVLDALSEIAADGDVGDVARGFQLYARAKPTNATFVASHVPAKILNHYLFRHRGVTAGAFLDWEHENKGWAEALKQSLRSPAGFVNAVEEMAVGIAQT